LLVDTGSAGAVYLLLGGIIALSMSPSRVDRFRKDYRAESEHKNSRRSLH